MPDELQPAFMTAVDEGKFKVIPNHLIPAKPVNKRGVVLLGDSLNMRHPLTGGILKDCGLPFKNCGHVVVAQIPRPASFIQSVHPKSVY